MNNIFISCKESRIEHNRSFYGCFYLGAFDAAQSLTVANALRRTLLSECPGVGIISVTIENVSHEYSTLPGMRESVLDLLLNLKEIVFVFKKVENETDKPIEFIDKQILTRSSKKPIVGYLKVKGPGVIRARDFKLPPLIQCVDPDQYIATLAEDGFLCMKFIIMEGKGYLIQKHNSFIDNTLVKKRANFLNELSKEQGEKKNFHDVLGVKAGKKEKNIGRADLTFTFDEPKGKQAKRKQESKPLNLDCIFNPVTKVNYVIEDFDNKITNDLNHNSIFVNDISSLIESSHFLTKNLPFLHDSFSFRSPKGNKGERGASSPYPLASLSSRRDGPDKEKRAVSNFVETYTKYEMEQLSSYLHPLKKPNTLHNIVLEIWTNGSLHPREALLLGFQNLGSLFLNLQKTKVF